MKSYHQIYDTKIKIPGDKSKPEDPYEDPWDASFFNEEKRKNPDNHYRDLAIDDTLSERTVRDLRMDSLNPQQILQHSGPDFSEEIENFGKDYLSLLEKEDFGVHDSSKEYLEGLENFANEDQKYAKAQGAFYPQYQAQRQAEQQRREEGSKEKEGKNNEMEQKNNAQFET